MGAKQNNTNPHMYKHKKLKERQEIVQIRQHLNSYLQPRTHELRKLQPDLIQILRYL